MAECSNHQHTPGCPHGCAHKGYNTDELHYLVKSMASVRGALGIEKVVGTLRVSSAQEKCVGRKNPFKNIESMEQQCGEASALQAACQSSTLGSAPWTVPLSACRTPKPAMVLKKSIYTRQKQSTRGIH